MAREDHTAAPRVAVDPAREPLLVAGRYRCGPVIARGASGEVRYGEDERLDMPVAIKSLARALADDADARRRFVQEARAAARVDHPNVVRVRDAGTHDGIPYVAMECLPGVTFADELSWGPITEERARRVGLDVLAALDAIHAAGIVHRDVKPSNLLLSAGSGGDVDGPVKLADFGIATIEASSEPGTNRDLTEPGLVFGTPAYLSPERVVGQPASPASDLYSLGVVLYEALAGVQPFVGDNPRALAFAIHEGEHVALGVRRPDLDPALVAAIERALAADPAQRWSDAAAMARALVATTSDLATQPLPALAATQVIPVHTPVASPARRRGVIGVVVAAGLVAALLLAGVLLAGATRSSRDPGVRADAATSTTVSTIPTTTTTPAPTSVATTTPTTVAARPTPAPVATKAVPPGKAKGPKGKGSKP